MKDLRSTPHSTLIEDTCALVREETRLTTEILHHLREIEFRRLHLAQGFGSLHEFCVTVLKYSDGAAHRRISAMRLLKDLPELEASLQAGTLSLTTASIAQGFFHQEKKSGRPQDLESKREMVQALQGKSRRECEQVLAALRPESTPAPADRQRVLSPSQTEVRFTANEALLKKLERIRSLLSHSLKEGSYAELLDRMAEITLEKLDPVRKELRREARGAARKAALKKAGKASSPEAGPAAQSVTPSPVGASPEKPRSRHIPAPLRRQVWHRDQGQCSFTDPHTGRKCQSTRFLQLDHRKPFARGGGHTLNNLRLYCANHNQHAAVQVFGAMKMAQHRKGAVP